MPFQFRKEAIEEDLNSNFPSQGQGNPPLYYSLSEVVVPTYSINQATEGSNLPENLQRAWDFSTGHSNVLNTATSLISNPGFWQVDLVANIGGATTGSETAKITIFNGLTSKIIFQFSNSNSSVNARGVAVEDKFVVFLRTGDTLVGSSNALNVEIDVWYRQIAELNGTLVNPLGYSAA